MMGHSVREIFSPLNDESALEDEENRLAKEVEDLLLSPALKNVPGNIVRRLIEYRCYALDQHSSFEEDGSEDKFSKLIEISRQFDRCEKFFVEEVAINSTTVWRWATGRTRPSRFIGKTLVRRLRVLLIDCIEADLHFGAVVEQQVAASNRSNV